MTLHLHHLTGCAPTPLAQYLKALGVLRLVAEQKDPEARGFWRDEHFCLLTSLDRQALERFFLDEYRPTPAFNPWGARSGFYSGSSESTARRALQALVRSTAPQLDPLRKAAAVVHEILDNMGGAKPETEEAKQRLLRELRFRLRGPASDWLAAVQAVVGEHSFSPALLGTGGNEGSGSYSSTYLQALEVALVDERRPENLGLFAGRQDARAGRPGYAWNGAFMQFMPEGSGSAWDFVLLLEGAVLLRSGVGLRFHTSGQQIRFLASPFYFAPHAVGSGSVDMADEYRLEKGKPRDGRGEQWFPLWRSPASLPEVTALFAQGRCRFGRRHAARPIDAVRAVAQLGVPRGINEFYRYGYLQRNNLATHFAVPLGRIQVRHRPRARLIDDLAPWMDRLHREARKRGAAARLVHAERRLADTVFAVLIHDDTPERWQAVLLAAVEVEAIQAAGTAFLIGPIPPLSPEWLAAGDDGTTEWRLAGTLGSAAAAYGRNGLPVDRVRHHWLPLQDSAPRYREHDGRLDRDPRVVAMGRDPVSDLAAVVERRLVEAAGRGERRLPVVAAPDFGASLRDLSQLLGGQVDLERSVTLARALMALRWTADLHRPSRRSVEAETLLDESWVAIRLACLPWPLDESRHIPADETIARRLRAGDAATAVEIAVRRLRAAGFRPSIRAGSVSPETCRRWAAALAFPIDRAIARALARRFEPTQRKEMP